MAHRPFVTAFRRIALAVAFLTVASCGVDVAYSPLGERQRAMAARDRWLDHAPATYSFTMRVNCFCIDIGEMRVVVEHGTVTSVRPVGYVLDAIDREAHSIHAEYDAALGFPAVVFIDYEGNIADEEWGFLVSDVTFP